MKAQVIVDAEASAEKRRIEAQGEAAAIYAKLEAEARGNFEILAKKGQGLKLIVESCGGAQEAFQMLMLEHIEELSKTAAQAIANVKFDKVVVWDGGGADGKNGTAGFLRGLAGALPPMMHMMRDIGGVQMPEYFGKLVEEEAKRKAAAEAPSAPQAAKKG
jgi:flotillin